MQSMIQWLLWSKDNWSKDPNSRPFLIGLPNGVCCTRSNFSPGYPQEVFPPKFSVPGHKFSKRRGQRRSFDPYAKNWQGVIFMTFISTYYRKNWTAVPPTVWPSFCPTTKPKAHFFQPSPLRISSLPAKSTQIPNKAWFPHQSLLLSWLRILDTLYTTVSSCLDT